MKSLSLRELARIRADKDNGLDDHRVSQEISILLRRTVISYCGRAMGASLSGENWVAQLGRLAGDNCFTAEQNHWLSVGQYQASVQCDMQQLLMSCENWIKALPRKTSDVAD